MTRVLAASLVFAAGAAMAQSSEPPKTPERPPLKLRLDEADLRSLNTQSGPAPTRETESNLPSLGGEARKIEAPTRRTESGSVYPKDSETWRRQ